MLEESCPVEDKYINICRRQFAPSFLAISPHRIPPSSTRTARRQRSRFSSPAPSAVLGANRQVLIQDERGRVEVAVAVLADGRSRAHGRQCHHFRNYEQEKIRSHRPLRERVTGSTADGYGAGDRRYLAGEYSLPTWPPIVGPGYMNQVRFWPSFHLKHG